MNEEKVMLTDKRDILNEVYESIKAVGGWPIAWGYIDDECKYIVAQLNEPERFRIAEIQEEIDSWGNIPVVYVGKVDNEVIFKVVTE